jgi:hypothetical protein
MLQATFDDPGPEQLARSDHEIGLVKALGEPLVSFCLSCVESIQHADCRVQSKEQAEGLLPHSKILLMILPA